MIKKLIAPLQKILLQKKLCPACTSDLTKEKDRKTRRADTEVVTCKCGRIFIYDKDLDIYRRALEEEV
ncbi:hypothetical protein KC717_06435 [Candidatus Dojkabacteria bacterium]|uniref:Uncharacterized protein n=1 Tax=Candidatus Dojkabacteria bacterium TaxID=2099670 RepID=A0A955LA00_9BACT|nr:hypothetical protein [Candidatus Dojkabacteria bacterium]